MALVVLAMIALGSGSDDGEDGDEPDRAELPGGGRQIFPARRVVAFYGAPQDEELGALGHRLAGPRRRRTLERQARPMPDRGGRCCPPSS